MNMSKEYVLMIREEQIPNFAFLMNLGAQLLEIQGMGLGGNHAAMLLATPIKPPVTPLDVPPPPAQPATPAPTEVPA